jgi:hypothetical protein
VKRNGDEMVNRLVLMWVHLFDRLSGTSHDVFINVVLRQ